MEFSVFLKLAIGIYTAELTQKFQKYITIEIHYVTHQWNHEAMKMILSDWDSNPKVWRLFKHHYIYCGNIYQGIDSLLQQTHQSYYPHL